MLRLYKMPSRMLGKVGAGSSGDRFLQKGAEWAGVKAAMMPPLGCRPASVRSTRPSLQLELQHHLRHRISS